jgi:hypothetical protein
MMKIARPLHIAQYDLRSPSGTHDSAQTCVTGPFNHDVRLIVEIDARQYPLSIHCRYARWRDPAGTETFTNLDFAPDSPGIRVGPWPGWRGIPGFPEIALSWGAESRTAVVHWWGDEFDRGLIRAVAWFPEGCVGEIRCRVADSRLNPVSVSIFKDSPVRAHPRQSQLLPSLKDTHPRILLTRAEITNLRSRAQSTHRLHMDRIHALLSAPPLPPIFTPESKTLSGPERLRSEDRAVLSALVALIEPSAGSTDAALAALRTFVAETHRSDFEPWGIDTQSGEILFLLCLLYDWLFDLMGQEELAQLRTWLWTVVGKVRAHLSPERADLAQAHYLGCGLGLLTFASVFYEDHPQAAGWLAECRSALGSILSMLPEDGFHPHGANMWIYEYGFLLRWVEIIRICTGEDLWHLPHWTHASAFRAATLSPDGCCGVTFGDAQYRVGGDAWCHYLIAARTGSGRAKAMGDTLVNGPHEGIDFRSVPPRRRAYEFLFDDPAVVPDRKRPAVEYFADGGQVTVRTGENTSGLFTFRSGPPIGAARYAAGERGAYGHADPCNGSFLWYVDGAFLVSGPGPVYRRDSSLHNIVTIDGHGQIGDGAVWLPDFFPPKTLAPAPEVTVDGEAVVLSVELARNYLPHLGVRGCKRSMYIDPVHERIVGVDTVECLSTSNIEWNLHSHAPFTPSGADGARSWRVVSVSRSMTAFLLQPDDGVVTTGSSSCVPAYPNDGTRGYFLRWSRTGIHAQWVWCLSLRPEAVAPVVRRLDGAIDLRFADGTRLYYDGSRIKVEGVR